jgi:hypothetical protein
VHGIDRGLDLVRTRLVSRQAGAHQCLAFVYFGAMPAVTVLLGEPHEPAGFIDTRVAPCVDEQHQRQQAQRFGLLWQHFDQQPTKADCLVTQLGANQRFTRGRAVAFIEDEIHDGEHAAYACGQFSTFGHAIRDACIADLGLRARQALCHGGFGNQECARDLRRGEAT